MEASVSEQDLSTSSPSGSDQNVSAANELSADEKNALSHRGQALRALVEKLK